MPSIYRNRGIYHAPYTLGIGAAIFSIFFHFFICAVLYNTKILNLKIMEDKIQRLYVDLVEIPSKTSEMEHIKTKYSLPTETSILRKSAEEILKDLHVFGASESSPVLSPADPSIQITDLLKKYSSIQQKPGVLDFDPDPVISSLPKESASKDELASMPRTPKVEVPKGRKIKGSIIVPALKQEELYLGSTYDWILPRQPTLQALEPLTAPIQPQDFGPLAETYPIKPPTVSLNKTVEMRHVETGNYKSLTNDVGVRFSIYHDARTDRQFFKIIITPKQGAIFVPIPKDVLFAVDVSRSILKSELRVVKSALASCLQALNKDDRFNVVIFSTKRKWLFSDFQDASAENTKSAVAFIDRLPNMNMTDIYTSLIKMLESTHRLQQGSGQASKRPCNIILISDGSPTTGIKDVRKIVGDLVHVRPANTSVFTFDIGKRGNRYLLDLIAFESCGYSWVEEDVKRGGFMLTEFIKRYRDPLLLHMVVNYANLEEGDIYPRVLPNLYRGEDIEIYGTCHPGNEVALRIVGDAYGEKCALTITKKIPIGGEGGPEIAREWAARKAYYLASRVALEGPKEEWLAEIERLREDFSINVPYSVAPGKNWFKNIFHKFVK
ncbi:MAG: VWA domain-containing protein [Candidatus Brocadiales bacterium]